MCSSNIFFSSVSERYFCKSRQKAAVWKQSVRTCSVVSPLHLQKEHLLFISRGKKRNWQKLLLLLKQLFRYFRFTPFNSQPSQLWFVVFVDVWLSWGWTGILNLYKFGFVLYCCAARRSYTLETSIKQAGQLTV